MVFEPFTDAIQAYNDAITLGYTKTKAFAASVATIPKAFMGFTSALALIGIATTIIQAVKRAREEAIQNAQAAAESYNDEKESLADYKSEVESLNKVVRDESSTHEEVYEAKKRLYEIQSDLTKEYGSAEISDAGLDTLTQGANDAADAFERLAAARASAYLAESGDSIKTAIDEMSKEREYTLGHFNWDAMSSDAQQAVSQIVAMNDNLQLTETYVEGLGNVIKLSVKGSVEDIKDGATAFKTEFDNLENPMKDMIYFIGGQFGELTLDESVANVIGKAGEVIDNYGYTATAGIDAYIQKTPEFKSAVNQMTDAQDDFAEATLGSTESTEENINALKNAIRSSEDALSNFDNVNWKLDGGEAVKKSLEDEYEAIQNQTKQLNLELKIATSVGAGGLADSADPLMRLLQDKVQKFADENGKIWADDILSKGIDPNSWWSDGVLDEQERAYADLRDIAERYGYTVEGMLSVLSEYGIVIGTNSKLIGDATKAYKNFTTESEAVNKVINEQNEGKSVSLETYESLIKISDDYADCLEYQGDTIQFNTEKLKELNEARNNEQYATIKANKANLQSQYNKNAEEVYSLTEALRDASFARSADGEIAKDRLSQLLEENNALSDNINKLNLMVAAMREASSARAAWLNAQDDPQPGDSFSDASGAIAHIWEVLNGSSATRGDVGTSKYKTALDYVIPVDKIKEGDAAIRQYLRSLQEILKMDGKGNVTDIRMDNIIKKLSQGKDAILEKGDDGNWIVKAGTDIEDFAKKLGVTEEMARSIIGMMNRNGADLKLDDRETESYIDKLEKAKEAVESFKNRDNMTSVNIDIDFSDLETAEEKLSALEESLAQAEELAKKNPVGSADYESAADIISYLLEQKKKLEYPVVMSIDANQIENDEVKNAVEEFQNLIDLQSELEYANRTGDTVGAEKIKKDIETAVEAIKDLDPDILEAFGFNIDELVDTKSFEDAAKLIESTLGSISENKVPDLASKLSIPESAFVGIQGIASTLEDMQGKTDVDVSIDCDSEPLQTALDYYNSLKNKTVYVNIVVTQSGGGRWFDGPGGGTWTDPVNAPVGTVNGTAHLHGTARASGDWGTAKAGRTLVGELGREIVVNPHTGRWYTVGDNGAEFVDMPGGAIVFNHLQTKHLLENRSIIGRGKALAGGTAAAMVPVSIIRDVPVSGTIPSSGSYKSSGSSSNSGYDGAAGKTSGSVSGDFKSAYDYHQHLLKMDKLSLEKYFQWLKKAYKDAYKAGQIELDDFYKYEEEVYELSKELFDDHLKDNEFKIETLLRDKGNESKVINIYNNVIKDIDKQIKAAKRRGLKDSDDYIQELLKQRHDYEDEIADLQDDANKDAKSAVEDLVDYRISMLKKYLEEEKDALNEKLDSLKDFYDKQKEMLQDVRDEEKYLEEQSEKRKAKDDIEAELKRLEFDNSAWAQRRKLELQKELVDAQKELKDFESDRALDKTQELLDDLYERQEKQIESEIEAIEDKLNDPKALYNQALADIQNNTLALYEEMVSYNDKYGSGNAEDTKEMWDEAKASLDKYLSTFGTAYKNIILTTLPGGYATGTANAVAGVHSVDELGPEYVFTSSNGARYRVFSGGEKVLNAKATNFLYSFANSGEKILSTIFEKIVGAYAANQISPTNRISEINMGDVIIQGNTNENTVSEIRRAKREEMQWILKEFNKMNKRS